MSKLENDIKKVSSQTQQDIFDYYFKSCDKQKLEETERLLEESPQALELYTALRSGLEVLSNELEEPVECPPELLEKTLSFVDNYAYDADPEPEDAGDLFQRILHSGFMRYAAVVGICILAVASFFPAASKMRFMASKAYCQANLAGISRGISSYSADNAGMFPEVAHKTDAPWWKVGSQSDKYDSNTRNYWLVVKNGYVPISRFRCPGRRSRVQPITPAQYASMQDFPSRDCVDYSFRIVCNDGKKKILTSRNAIAADMNPIFDGIASLSPQQQKDFLRVHLTEENKKAHSRNHSSRGQNVMFSDGSVEFISNRNLYQDDIYTLNGVSTYRGNEVPLCSKDTFLAP